MNNLNSIDEVNNEQAYKKLFKEIYITSDYEKHSPDDVAKVAHFGNNRHKIFIGVSGENKEILSTNERGFLQKILAAVKLNEDDVFITSMSNIKHVAFNGFITNNAFDKFIFFGIIPKDIDWHLEIVSYQKINFMEKDMLFAETLAVLISNEAAKKKLWIQLQSIFNIK